MATHIVHDDEATRAVERALAQAARRGVRVRSVIDGFGSHDSLDLIEPRLRAAGVAVAVFRPLSRWTHWLQPGQPRLAAPWCCASTARPALSAASI